MRVLVTVNDAYGHVLPLVDTVREMSRRGHDVVVACPGGTAAALGLNGVRLSRYEQLASPVAVPAPPRDDHAARLAWAVRTSWPNAARGWAPALLADAREFGPDLVMCEPVEHAGRVVAAALGVPLVEHGWGFSLPAGSDRIAADGLADLYRAIGATPREPVLRADLGPGMVQAGDIEPGVLRYRYMPWAPAADALPRPTGRPRILLTLGTFPHPGAADRLRAAAAAIAGLDVEPAVVLGHDDRGDDLGWPTGTLVTRWVDLPAEIAQCALVVHHGGAGTCWAAMAAGVPSVCLPQAGDQFRNASLIAGTGAAVTVLPEVIDVPALRGAFAGALATPALVAGAERVRVANEGLPRTAALVDRIESLCR